MHGERWGRGGGGGMVLVIPIAGLPFLGCYMPLWLLFWMSSPAPVFQKKNLCFCFPLRILRMRVKRVSLMEATECEGGFIGLHGSNGSPYRSSMINCIKSDSS